MGLEISLKIAMFTDSYLPYNSGVVHSIETLKQELTSAGHEVYIFAPGYPGCRDEDGRIFRFFSVPAPTNADYFLAFPLPGHLKAILAQIKLDVVHVHHFFGLGRAGMWCARRLGLPLVYTCHTLYEYYSHYLPVPRYVARELIRKVCANFCNRCDVIVTPTTATRDYLEHIGVRAPLRVVPTGIKVEAFNEQAPGWLRGRYNIKPGEKILLCVARLGPEKNIDFVLQCFAGISEEFPGVRLVLVGKGPQEKELRRLADSLGVGDKVIFTGLLTREEVARCYRDADIFVFASISETQGLVVPEAKSAGLPVVAVRANGVSEMVEDGVDGFLTGLCRDEFMDKIRLLLCNEALRREMAEKSLANSRALSSVNYASKILDVYRWCQVLKG
jgi:glycosyltransferase involved in cell wall biosynthesis